MRIAVPLRKLGADRRRHAKLSAPALAAAFAVALAGCAPDFRPGSRTRIPLPSQALLKLQPKPYCEFKATGREDDKSQPQRSQTDSSTDDSLRMKFDYERQCYRHAEILVRARLRLLQASVGETIKAVKRSEQSSW